MGPTSINGEELNVGATQLKMLDTVIPHDAEQGALKGEPCVMLV